jgi:hypothetical protein
VQNQQLTAQPAGGQQLAAAGPSAVAAPNVGAQVAASGSGNKKDTLKLKIEVLRQ